VVYDRGEYPVGFKHTDADGRSYYINYRVDSPNLVEMHLVQRLVMNLRLGLCHPHKYSFSQFFSVFVYPAFVYYLKNIAEIPVLMVMVVAVIVVMIVVMVVVMILMMVMFVAVIVRMVVLVAVIMLMFVIVI